MTGRVIAVLLALLMTGGLAACAAVADPASSAGGPAPSPVEPTASAGSGGGPGPSPDATGEALSRDDGWRADIDAMLAGRERIHPDPWYGMERAEWVAAAEDVKRRIPTLDDDEALVPLVRLGAMPTWTGRDGHTAIFPFVAGSGTHVYPIQMWPFSDGLVITAARAPHEDLVGSRIDTVEGRPIADVLELVEPLAPRDNPSNLRLTAPLYLRVSELLSGLGVIESVGPATFGLVDQTGVERDVEIEPITVDDDVAWRQSAGGSRLLAANALWLEHRDTPLWSEFLDDSGTLYVMYDAVQRGIDQAAQDILDRVKDGGVERVVVDIRRNGGGNNQTFGYFQGKLRDPAIDRPGRLVILTGPMTFSAAANFATDLEQTTSALFAGEDMGGSPNLFGDTAPVTLKQSGQTYHVAARYWERSTPDDPRITIEPDLEITMSSADYFAGRDPVLDAVIANLPPDP